MQRLFFYLFAIIVLLGGAGACRKNTLPAGGGNEVPHPDPPPAPPVKLEETEPPVLTAVTDSVSDNIRGFYQSLPARYAESKEKYPVILDFHGGGQYGNGSTQLPNVLKMGIPKVINEGRFPPSFTVDNEKFSFIVIAPQLMDKVANVEMLNLLEYVRKHYRIDSSRIYLTGFSLGGRQAANYAGLRADQFAALATFGGLPQIDNDLVAKCKTMVDADLPIWHFHNRDDEAWAYSEAEQYIHVLDSLQPSIAPRFTTFDIGEGKSLHDCWTRGTNPEYKEDGKNLYEWLLSHKR